MKPEDIAKLIKDAGGTVVEVGSIGGGDGVMTATFPLPEDHWLTKGGHNVPPMPWRCGTDNPMRERLVDAIREAGKYACRAATMNGKEMDFDPDAMLQNLVVGFLGYWTPDGLSEWKTDNPNPVPPEVEAE